jgi:hypothetical protein
MRRLRALYRLRFRGAWIVVVCYLIAVVGSVPSPFSLFVRNLLRVPRECDSPTHYLQGFVADGLSAAIALLFVMMLAYVYWRRYPRFVPVGIFFPWVLLTGKILFALAILWRALEALDPKEADSILAHERLRPWAYDTALWSGAVVLAILSAAAYIMIRREKSQRRKQQEFT